MNEKRLKPINDWAKRIRKKQIQKESSKPKNNPIKVSWNKLRIFGKTYDSLNIILRTTGCRWAREGGCSMCGYLYDTSNSIKQRNIINQLNRALRSQDFKNQFFVKIFTSGSFLDDQEIRKKTRTKIINKLNEEPNFLGLSIESRPEFITEEKIRQIKDKVENLIIGIGLETSDDEIRLECINKGFNFKEYREALKVSLKNNVKVKTYLLLKPPFLSEKNSIKDTINSAKKASELGSFKISVNPCNVQRGTIVEELYKNDEYTPPWFWSLIKVLKETDYLEAEVISEPTAAGKKRGIHNCQECNDTMISKVRKYSKTQNIEHLKDIYCGCKEEWKSLLENEIRSHNLISGR